MCVYVYVYWKNLFFSENRKISSIQREADTKLEAAREAQAKQVNLVERLKVNILDIDKWR